MKNNKRYIILLILLFIFGLLMYLFIGKESIAQSKNKTTILLNPNTIFKYNKNQWIKINNTTIEDYQWKKYSVFLNSKYTGDYYVWNDDSWYIFDDNKNAINYTDNFLAINSNFELSSKEFEVIDASNSEYIRDFLNQKGISINTELTATEKVLVDIDNDGIDEEIYIVSNTFTLELGSETIFSYVFMIKNNEVYIMYEREEEGDVYSGCLPSINSIIDVDNDKTDEIILTCARYSAQEPINYIYKFENKAFRKLISSE